MRSRSAIDHNPWFIARLSHSYLKHGLIWCLSPRCRLLCERVLGLSSICRRWMPTIYPRITTKEWRGSKVFHSLPLSILFGSFRHSTPYPLPLLLRWILDLLTACSPIWSYTSTWDGSHIHINAFFLPAQEKNQRSLLPLNYPTFERRCCFSQTFYPVLSLWLVLSALLKLKLL